jgi:organic hydroperoxide reductase OsmC/OhrA
MSVHKAKISWQQDPHSSDSNTYSRNHLVELNSNQHLEVPASEEFKGDAHCADPEQMLVSAVSSCHMLLFLAIAEFQGLTVESYEDNPDGHLENNLNGGSKLRLLLSRPA